MKTKVLLSCLGLMCLLAIAGLVHHFNKTEIRKLVTEKKKDIEMAVLVKFKVGFISSTTLQHVTNEIKEGALRDIFELYHIPSMSCVFQNRYGTDGRLKPNLANQNFHQLEGWQKVILPSLVDAQHFLAAIINQPEVEHALLNEPFGLKPAVTSPNDPSYTAGQQWHLNDAVANIDIDAPEAWDINRGRNDVIVAILDGGVDYTHADMDPGNRSRVIAGIDTGSGDNDPMDDIPNGPPGQSSFAGHGTSVAGIVGAITNNNYLEAGVMWNCRIMPVKMVTSNGLVIKSPFGGTIVDFSATAIPSDVANAIDYAVNNGAHVINLSYGFHAIGFPIDQVILQIPLLYQTLNNAYLNNVVTCAAMGNEFLTDNSPSYPAGFKEQVIPVGALDRLGAKASFSNTGPHISVSAPGVGIVTTARGGGVNTSFGGTSAASPIVAGVAGLIISQGKDRNFNLTNNDVKHIIEITAIDKAAPGFDNETGFGIVNAKNALQLLAPPNVVYHYTSTGGTSTKIATISPWIILDNRWGIAAGSYFNVDQYKMTKHVNFDIPFCTTPQVWLRERECTSLDYARPNSGRPAAFITNVTSTGFDLEYVTYFVKTSATGATINQWVPAAPASSTVAYTTVGQPNPAALAGPIAGLDLLCTTGTYTLQNVPIGGTVTWSSSNTSGLSVNASSGVATRVNNFNGQATITATVGGFCANVLVTKTIWVGAPPADNSYLIWLPGMRGVNPVSTSTGGAVYNFNVDPVPNATSYTWQPPPGFVAIGGKTTSGPSVSITTSSTDGTYTLFCRANNACGFSWTNSLTINNSGGGGGGIQQRIAVFPNPATTTFNVILKPVDSQEESQVSLFNKNMERVYYTQTTAKEIVIPIDNIPDGNYFLKIQTGKEITQKQIVIKH